MMQKNKTWVAFQEALGLKSEARLLFLEFYVVCAAERIPPLFFSTFNCGRKYFMDFLFTLIDPVAALDNSNPPVRYVVVILKGFDQFASNFFVLLSFSFLIKRMSIDLENQTWSPLSNFFLLSVSGGTTDLA